MDASLDFKILFSFLRASYIFFNCFNSFLDGVGNAKSKSYEYFSSLLFVFVGLSYISKPPLCSVPNVNSRVIRYPLSSLSTSSKNLYTLDEFF